MNDVFPYHPCVLHREDNPFVCDSLKDAGPSRCAVCRMALRGEVWGALMEGDRSLAEFVLANDVLTESGFAVRRSENVKPGSAVLVLAGPENCTVEPDPTGGFTARFAASANACEQVACEDFGSAWLIFRRRLHSR